MILGLYIGVGVTLVLILRAMSRRWRTQPALADTEVPYGPREPVAKPDETEHEVPVS